MGHVSAVRNFKPLICEAKWNSTCKNHSLSPLIKWPCRTLCPLVKDGLKKITLGSVESRLARLLPRYRVTPQSVTEVSLAELMFGRKLRTRLDLLQLDLGSKVR